MKWITLDGTRIRPESIEMYRVGYYISGVGKGPLGNYEYTEGTEISFKDGTHKTFKTKIDQVDLLLGEY